MRIIVIGAVAAGTSAAAKARRNREDAEIVIYDKDRFISYSGCGTPYAIGGLVPPEALYPRDPDFFKAKYNIDVLTGHEVLAIHPDEKTLEVRDLDKDRTFQDRYDILILATGASAFVPPVPGSNQDHVFVLRNIGDMHKIRNFIAERRPRSAVIAGTGSIGLELAENLIHLGIPVTMAEMAPQVLPALDEDMGAYVREHLESKGVAVHTGFPVSEIGENQVLLSNGRALPGDMVFLAAGIRPDSRLAAAAGIDIGVAGAIKVTPRMETSREGIYACGDCAENVHLVTGQPVWRPLGSTANKTGRIAGDAATGGSLEFRGILGTAILRAFDLAIAMTGLTEKEALKLGYDVEVSLDTKYSRADYLGGKELVIKGVADRRTGRLLGVQIIGEDGVDKRIDVFATAITYGALAEDLFHLDLAYAPPFSTAKDPVMYTGMILDNAIHRGRKLITPEKLDALVPADGQIQIIDAREPAQFAAGHVPGARNIPHNKLREVAELPEEAGGLRRDVPTVTYCNKGVTGNATQNILMGRGFSQVYTLAGGHRHYCACKGKKTK